MEVSARVSAISSPVLEARTVMSPPSPPPASRSLSTTVASAEASSRLVAITPLTASEVPSPSALPPEEEAMESVFASIRAFSTASTRIAPPAASTSAPTIRAVAPPRSSL